MSKYELLGKHLENSGKTTVNLTFTEIESILKIEKLPKSLYKYPAAWYGTAEGSDTHVWKMVWCRYGYQVKTVNLDAKNVVFVKYTKLEINHTTKQKVVKSKKKENYMAKHILQEKTISEMRDMELKLLIIEYNKASQLDRSFSKTKLTKEKKKLFRKKLIENCIFLMKSIDDGSLTNKLIREKIKELKNIDDNISFGQAQKVINVSLKQYCFITMKENLLKELDCPLDSTTMKSYGIMNKNMIKVTEKDYLKYQDIFKEEFNGNRILKDCIYDENRINNFLTLN